MRLTYDAAKRAKTFRDRGLDFTDAVEVFNGPILEFEDQGFDYGETRIATIGRLRGRMVIVIWTARGDARHIISMRKLNGREQARFGQQLGPG